MEKKSILGKAAKKPSAAPSKAKSTRLTKRGMGLKTSVSFLKIKY